MTEIFLPDGVRYIIKELNIAGFDGYIVGGSVRDSLLGRPVKDYDIVTTALPHEIQGIFYHTVPLGIKHGTITVILGDESFEITTMKKYHNSTYFSLAEDLSLRDFTINAMAYNRDEGLIDLYDGLGDLDQSMITCVGNPDDVFGADPLRMMRAIRFECELGFQMSFDTWEGLSDNSELIKLVSSERVREELNKIIISNPINGIDALFNCGILKIILPEFERCFYVEQNSKYHFANVGVHSAIAMNHAVNEKDLTIMLTLLLHDIGKFSTKTTVDGIDHFYDHQFVSAELANEILKRLKYDNDTINNVCRLIESHMDAITPNKRVVRRSLNKLGVDLFQKFLVVKKCDGLAHTKEFHSEKLFNLDETKKIMFEILEENSAFSLKDLAVNGDDLLKIGFKSDKKLGETLKFLLDVVIDNPELNNREYLLDIASKKVERKYGCINYDEGNS